MRCDLIQSFLHCKGVPVAGQRTTSANTRSDTRTDIPSLSIFPTNLGWFGLLGCDSRLAAVFAGHGSANEVRRAAGTFAEPALRTPVCRETDWNPDLRRRLERYCLGDRIEFDDLPLALPAGTEFRNRVIKVVRRVRYGKTISYGRLAEKA